MKQDPDAQELFRKLAGPEPAPPRPGPGSPPKGGRAQDARGGERPGGGARPDYLSGLVGEAVRIHLTSGEVVEGRIAGVRTYEVLMEDGAIVMKGAISTIRRATAPP
jgi:hypothetical protein